MRQYNNNKGRRPVQEHQSTMDMMPPIIEADPMEDDAQVPDTSQPPTPDRPRTKKGKLKCLHKGRAIMTGLFVSCLITAGTMGMYYNFITYPPIEKRDEEHAGLGAIRRLNKALQSRDFNTIVQETGEKSYMGMEALYANSDEDILQFMDNVFGTVRYTPKRVEGKNIYGNTMIEKTTQDVVFVESLVNDEKDTVALSFIDYTKIKFNNLEIQNFLKTNNIAPGSPDYDNQVVKVFCKYMNSLKWADMELKTIDRNPELTVTGEGMKYTKEEDIYLDKLLFSSEEFADLLNRFDIAANGGEIPVTNEWNEWNKLNDKDKKANAEPAKHSHKHVISRYWCGAYYLQNEHTNAAGELVPIMPQSGNGTLEKPAAIGTSVLTNLIAKVKGKEVAFPIRVELVEILFNEECHAYLAEKDTRNRGLDESSHNKYASLRFQVTNLADQELTIPDNSSLADKAGNLSARTGNMYGLKSQVTIKPGESGIIETWVASTELDRKYLIWGADFEKKAPVVYFGVLNAQPEEEETENKDEQTEQAEADSEGMEDQPAE